MDCFESLWVLKGNRKETATENQAFLAPRSPQILTLVFKDLIVMNSPVQHMVPIIWGYHDLGNLMKPHETRGFPPSPDGWSIVESQFSGAQVPMFGEIQQQKSVA